MTVAELVAKLGLNMKREDWDRAQSTMGKLKTAAEGLVAALGVRQIKTAIDGMITGVVESASEVDNLSKGLGISTDKIQELGYAGREVGAGQMHMALRRLSMAANEASRKGGETGAMFARMGVHLRGANGQLLPADQLLEQVADGMTRVKNPTEKTALAMQLFGRSGSRMLRMLDEGSAGLRKEYAAAQRLGVMSKETIALAKKEELAQYAVDYTTKALHNSIVEKLLPGKIWLLEKTRQLVEWFVGLAKHTNIVKEVMVALGIVVGILAVKSFIAFFAVLGPLGSALLLFGAIMFLVIDDILTSIRGGQSMGRDFVDWVGQIYDKFMAWQSINPVIQALIDPLKGLVKFLKMSVDLFNALIMAATGDFSGFRLIQQGMKESIDAWWEGTKKKVGADMKAIGSGVVSVVAGNAQEENKGLVRYYAQTGAVSPSASSVSSRSSSSVSTGPMTVNQTINASPGQDAGAVGDAAAASFQGVHDNMVEQAYNKLIPSMAFGE